MAKIEGKIHLIEISVVVYHKIFHLYIISTFGDSMLKRSKIKFIFEELTRKCHPFGGMAHI